MAVRDQTQNTFDAGEVSPQFLRRMDTEELSGAAKLMRNVIPIKGGGFKRRPGTALEILEDAPGRGHVYKGSVEERLIFQASQVVVYNTSGGLLQTLTGFPWASGDLAALVITEDDDQVYVFHADHPTQTLTRASDGTWSRADFAFSPGYGNGIHQPYLRIEPPGVSMTPVAYTGAGLAVTFSDGFLTNDHIGARIRYLGKNEMEITSVFSATQCTVTVRQDLFPSVTLTVTTPAGDHFKPGHVIIGETSERRAVVTSASATQIVAIMLDGYEVFDTISGSLEEVIGPEGETAPTAQATNASPQATTIWDEQLVSAARGYPGCGAVHRGRLWMGGFPAAPSAIAASAVNAYTLFLVGADAADAIVEYMGTDKNARLRYILSAEQLLTFTDRGCYYVPEAAETPITPTSIAFLQIGPEGAAQVQPALSTEGAIFVDEAANRLLAAVPTGNVRRSWVITELSEGADHLLTGPEQIAVANGLDGERERYVVIRNTDGTAVAAMYRRGAERMGFVGWSHGKDSWVDLFAIRDQVFLVAHDDATDYRISRLDFSSIVDDEQAYTAAVTDRDGHVSHVVKSQVVIGSGTPSSGEISGLGAAVGQTIGSDFAVSVETTPPFFPELGLRRLKISNYRVDLIAAGLVRVAGREHSPSLILDDLDSPGVTRSRVVEGYKLGWDYEPTLTIEQRLGQGAPFEVRALSYKVTI